MTALMTEQGTGTTEYREETIWSDAYDGVQKRYDWLCDEARDYVDYVIEEHKNGMTLVDAAEKVGDDYVLGLTTDVLKHAAENADEPTAESLTDAIDDADDWAALGEPFLSNFMESVRDDREDEAGNLKGAKLDRPVIMLVSAGLWDGTHTNNFIHEFESVGDIIAESPYTGMDSEEYLLTDDGDLAYKGHHHDGTNTVRYRLPRKGVSLKKLASALDRGDEDAVNNLTESLRPYVLAALGRDE